MFLLPPPPVPPPSLFKCFRYSTKLRALSDAQVADFGAKLALECKDVAANVSCDSISGHRDTSIGSLPRQSFYGPSDFRDSESPVGNLGLGEFLRELEGADAVSHQDTGLIGIQEISETIEMTPEQ